jgi:hypothetical protein
MKRTVAMSAMLGALTLSSAAARSAVAAEPAAAFAHRIVALYASKSRWANADNASIDREYHHFYDPAFARLITDNGRLAGTKAGGVDLDDDPVCGGCQDGPDDLRVVSIDPKGEDRADLHMAGPDCGAKPPECTRYVIVIQRMSGRWKIFDVVDGGGSVRAMLMRHNACLRRARSEAEAGNCVQ